MCILRRFRRAIINAVLACHPDVLDTTGNPAYGKIPIGVFGRPHQCNL